MCFLSLISNGEKNINKFKQVQKYQCNLLRNTWFLDKSLKETSIQVLKVFNMEHQG